MKEKVKTIAAGWALIAWACLAAVVINETGQLWQLVTVLGLVIGVPLTVLIALE